MLWVGGGITTDSMWEGRGRHEEGEYDKQITSGRIKKQWKGLKRGGYFRWTMVVRKGGSRYSCTIIQLCKREHHLWHDARCGIDGRVAGFAEEGGTDGRKEGRHLSDTSK